MNLIQNSKYFNKTREFHFIQTLLCLMHRIMIMHRTVFSIGFVNSIRRRIWVFLCYCFWFCFVEFFVCLFVLFCFVLFFCLVLVFFLVIFVLFCVFSFLSKNECLQCNSQVLFIYLFISYFTWVFIQVLSPVLPWSPGPECTEQFWL